MQRHAAGLRRARRTPQLDGGAAGTDHSSPAPTPRCCGGRGIVRPTASACAHRRQGASLRSAPASRGSRPGRRFRARLSRPGIYRTMPNPDPLQVVVDDLPRLTHFRVTVDIAGLIGGAVRLFPWCRRFRGRLRLLRCRWGFRRVGPRFGFSGLMSRGNCPGAAARKPAAGCSPAVVSLGPSAALIRLPIWWSPSQHVGVQAAIRRLSVVVRSPLARYDRRNSWMILRTNDCSRGLAWSRTCCAASPPVTGAATSTWRR